MAVDTFYRRTPPDEVAGLDEQELADLVPYWHDQRFRAERDRGILFADEDDSDLLGCLLMLGAGDGPDRDIAKRLYDGPVELEDEDAQAGVYRLEDVERAARFLAGAPLREWAREFEAELAVAADQSGYTRPFDAQWSASVVATGQSLARLYRTAAEHGEVVVVRVAV